MTSWMARSAGALLHVSSLPSGRLGADAERFATIAGQAGLRVWQLLPVGPRDSHGNPFQPRSACAGDTALLPPGPVPRSDADFTRFCEAQRDWLDDWTLFVALKQSLNGTPWWHWPAELRDREPAALTAARMRLSTALEAERRAQHAFDRAWRNFREIAKARGLLLFGDVPLFMAHDSADVWAHRELFEVAPDGREAAAVGVPPDAFSATGQWWGYPPYRWDVMAASGFSWWKRRFEVQAARFDLVRLDHFRGFAAWWRIPRGAATAAEGEWIPGPGRAAIDALQPVLGGAGLVAEDLGIITDDVIALRRALGIPGMRVLQFAWDGHPDNPHLPANHGPNTVCYTGTHDNDTTLGWWRSAPEWERDNLRRYLNQANPDMPQALIDCAWASPAPLAIAPMQDLLGLGSEARMNLPGTAEGNWHWRFDWPQVPADFGDRLHAALERHGRLPAVRG